MTGFPFYCECVYVGESYLNETAHGKTSLLFAYTERSIIMAMYFTQAQALLGADVWNMGIDGYVLAYKLLWAVST